MSNVIIEKSFSAFTKFELEIVGKI